jgi:hypothetical protein
MSNLSIKGRCIIHDEDGNVVLDKTNDIHPGNISRMIARSLAHESNYWVNSIAFGNLGTYQYDGKYVHRTSNDGIEPDYAEWQSALYNEIYREYIDDHYDTISEGSASELEFDQPSISGNSNSAGVSSIDDNFSKSRVVINCELNHSEPNDLSDFTFDEIALYSGISKSKFSGYQLVDISNGFDSEDTGLLPNTEYSLNIKVGKLIKTINIKTPKHGTGNNGNISYFDLLKLLNQNKLNIAVDVVDIVNGTNIIPRKV